MTEEQKADAAVLEKWQRWRGDLLPGAHITGDTGAFLRIIDQQAERIEALESEVTELATELRKVEWDGEDFLLCEDPHCLDNPLRILAHAHPAPVCFECGGRPPKHADDCGKGRVLARYPEPAP